MDFLNSIREFFQNADVERVMTGYFIPAYTVISRFVMPVFAFMTIYGALLTLRARAVQFKKAGLISNAGHIPFPYRENLIGRERGADVILDIPSVSRKHAVIKFEKDIWYITDLESRSGIRVNGETISKTTALRSGDCIELGGVDFMFDTAIAISENPSSQKTIPIIGNIMNAPPPSFGRLLFFMTAFQIMAFIQVILRADAEHAPSLVTGFAIYFALEWFCFIFSTYILRYKNFAHELIGFYLTGIGLCVIAASEPTRLTMQLIIIGISAGLYYIVFSLVRKWAIIKRLRPILACAGLALFAVNLALGTSRFGSKNWLELFGFSFQPSELVKVIFVLVGAVSLEMISGKKDLLLFSAYSCVCMFCLFIMGDFGTAAIFFVTFIVIFIMRTGNLKLTAGICLGAVLGAALIILIRPYIANRFAAWRHVWEHPSTIGYQQTRTLIAAASGGLLGVGGGAGYLRNVAAATTDLVFGVLCEEWGLITAVLSVGALVGLCAVSCGNIKNSRSSYHAIAGCAAAALLIFQACLNIFGSTDILPLTGVTLPFVSRGGSSMLSCWMMLAVLKTSHIWEKLEGA